jgi:hypothetical protein
MSSENIRVFRTKWFSRYAAKHGIEDADLREAVRRAEAGLIDADLGGGLIKQRVARAGQGRSRGFRTLVLYRDAHRAIFQDAFAKSERDNLDDDEEKALRRLALEFLAYTDAQILALLERGEWIEVRYEQEASQSHP